MDAWDETYAVGSDAHTFFNLCDSMESAASENFRDVRGDAIFSDDEVITESLIIRTLRAILDNHAEFAPYL